jgi:transcriptional regulator of acetoin/glycerol metabolism
VMQLDDDVLGVLKAYSWPGNVRQMENVIERALVVAEGDTITLTDLPEELTEQANLESSARNEYEDEEDAELVPAGIHGERAARHRKERERLIRALSSARGNKAEAARALGLARSTLVSRLKKHGLS